ncbi:MAG: serine/threonine protein kinase [Planctomycetes bacterium]|nr:serine/threonine protein kinase [Planctomycetota bacterium]
MGFEQRSLGPTDITVDGEISTKLGATSDHPSVHLAADSASESDETRNMLRTRLRFAGLTLFMGFAVFLIWHVANFLGRNIAHAPLLVAHVAVTVFLGACALMLCRKCPMSSAVLRVKELVVFGLPAAFLLFWQFVYTTEYVKLHNVLPDATSMWLMLIFIYALFIPNSWQRASVFIFAFALAPIAMTVLLVAFDPMCAAAGNCGFGHFSQLTLKTLVGAVAAVMGVFTIGRLRTEAFKAKQLGQYKLGRLLGAGGMGEVYEAEHQLMRRPCAIKLIRPSKADDPRVLARFEREVRFSAKLSHWNNIDIFDYGRADDGTFYYVMEYLPGMNLEKIVQQFGPLPAERVIYLLRQVCDALNEAHSIGLIHRDIKPANIFAAQRGGMYDVAKVLDYGLVKSIIDVQSSDITQEGTIAGSPLYVSPEQVAGDPADSRSDIYSLGATAYYLLTGKPPFNDETPMKVLLAHTNREPLPPVELRPEIPPKLQEIVLRCLAKSRDDRFQTTAQLHAALEECESADRWTQETAQRWWRERTAESEATVAVSA